MPRPFPTEESVLSSPGSTEYTRDQGQRLQEIHKRLIEARRELDALIGDAYLRPRASIVPVHFLDLASAAEKLRWAEKEWRELDREKAETQGGPAEHRPAAHPPSSDGDVAEEDPESHFVTADAAT